MNDSLKLVKAIHAGDLRAVKLLLEAGLPLEWDVGGDEPNFELGLACFAGHVEIIHALVARGARVNCGDNRLSTSPLSMAIRGGHRAAICTLIELGASVPEGMVTGLTEHQMTVAHLKAIADGRCQPCDSAHQEMAKDFQEIHAAAMPGTDTEVLESEVLRSLMRDMR